MADIARSRPPLGRMVCALAVALALLTTGCRGDEPVTTVGAEATPTCPDRGSVAPEDAGPPPDRSAVVTDGVHDGRRWCLEVTESVRVGRCVGLVGEAAPEGEQLSGGSCMAGEFGWSLHGVTLDSLLVIGYAPPATTHVRLRAPDGHLDIDELVATPAYDDLVFFVAPLPADFMPDTGVAMRGDATLARHDMPRGACTSEARIDEDGRTYGRSTEHDCKFVDDDGNLMPGQ